MKRLLQTLFFCLLANHFGFAQGTWTKIGDMPEIRYAHTADEINGKVYITGGVNTEQGAYPKTMLVYDEADSSWSTIPLPGNSLRGQHTSCVVDSNLYIIGGGILLGGTVNSTDSMYMFQPSTGEWIAKNPMPTDRLTLACALLDGKIYVAGGLHCINGVPNYNGLKTFEVYDLATETWSALPDMPRYRWGLSIVAFEGKIYVFGGRGISIRHTVVDVYDPQDSSWTPVTNIPTPRYQLSTCVVDSNIYTIDGWYSSGLGPIYDTVEVYNPITDLWTTGTSMPVSVAMLDGFTLDGKIYMYGGSYTTHPNIGISDIWEFTPSLPAGTYTIGTGGDFATIQDAFDTLSNEGIAGPVTLELIDELYTAPTGQYGFLLDGPIPGAGPESRITIKPAENKNVTIEGSCEVALCFINTSYMTLDGVGVDGPTTLTVYNLNNVHYQYSDAVGFLDNSDHNIVENCILISDGYLKGSSGILFFPVNSTTEVPDSNLIRNNFVKRVGIGIYVGGKNQNTRAVGNIIRGNMVGSEIDSLITWGIQDQNTMNSIIDSNIVQNINQQFNLSVITPGINSAFSSGTIIRNNVVHKVSSSNLYGSTGILVSGDVGAYGVNNLVYNNMVYDIQSTSTNPSSRVAGIQLWYQTNPKIYYNSVNLSGTGGINPGGSGALFITWTETVTGLDVKNNIFVNTRNESPYCASSICDYASTTFTSDYNDLFYDDTNPNNCLVKIGSINYLTLADWQATGKDLNSITEMPHFIDPNDLHIDGNYSTLLDSGATPITEVPTDIDGQPRNVAVPDIGADEFDIITGVEDEVTVPTEFALEQNFPNPFNPSTKIKYSVPQPSQVQIKIFDVLGNEIGTLVSEEKPAGIYELTWNAANLPSGIYFYQLKAGEFISTKKMILLK